MKGLSIKSPWVDLIMRKDKTIEVRNWVFKDIPKIIYIHKSKKFDKEAPKKYKINRKNEGKVLAKAKIKDVKEYHSITEFKKDENRHLAPSKWYNKKGKTYGFVLGSIKRLKRPFYYRANVKSFKITKK